VGKLFAFLTAAIAVVSAAFVVAKTWWLPPDVSVLGSGIDHQLGETMLASGILFVLAQLVLALYVWQAAAGGPDRPLKTFPGGATPMVVGAIVLVGIEILVLSFVGTKVWANIFLTSAGPDAVKVDVLAEQFAFYFRYPGADGKFGQLHPELIDDASGNYFGLDPANDTAARDDIVVGTLTIPVNREISLTMHSKDVGHGFYAPDMRFQQDFLPGMMIPLHFTATKIGKHEVVCTQLCGLGHYNMKAYIDVVSQEDFDKFLKDQAAQQ